MQREREVSFCLIWCNWTYELRNTSHLMQKRREEKKQCLNRKPFHISHFMPTKWKMHHFTSHHIKINLLPYNFCLFFHRRHRRRCCCCSIRQHVSVQASHLFLFTFCHRHISYINLCHTSPAQPHFMYASEAMQSFCILIAWGENCLLSVYTITQLDFKQQQTRTEIEEKQTKWEPSDYKSIH